MNQTFSTAQLTSTAGDGGVQNLEGRVANVDTRQLRSMLSIE